MREMECVMREVGCAMITRKKERKRRRDSLSRKIVHNHECWNDLFLALLQQLPDLRFSALQRLHSCINFR